jgi:PAS domain-containing protein
VKQKPIAQQAVELILMRQLASYLTVPIFIAGADERLVFYNEAAEKLIGRSYDEAGQMALVQLPKLFATTNLDGSPLKAKDLPITIALRERRPAHSRIRFRGLDGNDREIDITAFPLEGQAGRHVGAVAIFWESKP